MICICIRTSLVSLSPLVWLVGSPTPPRPTSSHPTPPHPLPTPCPTGGDLYSALRRHPQALAWGRLGRRVLLDVALGLNHLHRWAGMWLGKSEQLMRARDSAIARMYRLCFHCMRIFLINALCPM